MILPHGANPDRMKFSERTGLDRPTFQDASLALDKSSQTVRFTMIEGQAQITWKCP